MWFQLTKYQEQPQLLDGSLEAIVQPLALLLQQAAASSTAQDAPVVQAVYRMLHVLVTVRGYKTVVRFFPHEAANLERVLQVSRVQVMVKQHQHLQLAVVLVSSNFNVKLS